MKFFKNLPVLLILLITGLTSNIYSQSNWILRSTGCNLNSVFFYDDMVGYVVGDSGTILATADAGANWQCITSGTSQNLLSIYFINSLTGWAAGTGGALIKTTNGGKNWTSLSSGTTNTINTIYFPDPDTGYFSGDFPLGTSKTTNGGTSWTSGGIPYGSSLFFSSGSAGLATNNSGYLAITTNGGASWTINSALGNPLNQHAISFVNANSGWTTGGGNRAFKTTNAGTNWVIQSNSASSSANFYGIDFTDDMNGYIAGYSGFFSGDTAVIYATTNGGANWFSQTCGVKKPLRDIDFTDPMNGWAVGDEGVILHTSNGGYNWSRQSVQYLSPFLQTYSINDITFINSMTGYSVGFSGYVNKTTDGGDNWTSYTSASFNWLFSVYFPEGNDTGWACGRLGTIEKTENAGVNWTLQSSGTGQHLNCITVDKYIGPSVLTGYCVGNNGTILATSSGGISWVPQISLTTNNLNSVFEFDDYNVIVCGDAGTILRTDDAGSNWVAKSSGTTEDLRSIYFINTSTGYVCGSTGIIKKTIDGGDTWTLQTSGTASKLNSIDFEETVSDNGYAVGENGTIVITSNGGLTWNKESSGSTNALYSVFVKEVLTTSYSPATLIKAVGNIGKYIIKKAVTVLPVELTSFSYSVNGNNVTLFWQTSAEVNNKGFQIERRYSGNNQWNRIGFIDGAGTISNTRSYTLTDKYINSGIYNYRLKQLDYNGNYKYYDLNSEVSIGQPDKFQLMQNYPNPFNPTTTINYVIPEKGFVSLKVYDLTGKEVKTVVNEIKEAGYYSFKFDGSGLSSGIYFYNLQSSGRNETKKMILVK